MNLSMAQPCKGRGKLSAYAATVGMAVASAHNAVNAMCARLMTGGGRQRGEVEDAVGLEPTVTVSQPN